MRQKELKKKTQQTIKQSNNQNSIQITCLPVRVDSSRVFRVPRQALHDHIRGPCPVPLLTRAMPRSADPLHVCAEEDRTTRLLPKLFLGNLN